MLCSAAAVWLLAALSPGLPLSLAEDASVSGSSLCRDCFYRQTPPEGAPGRPPPPPRPLCHRLPGGRTLATASSPTCDTAVYSAFHLAHGWAERESGGEGESRTETEDNAGVLVPALLRGGLGPSSPGSPSDPLLQLWDSTVTTLVQSVIGPSCSGLGGDLYVLTGRGHPWGREDGDECQPELLWSAVCCSVPGGGSDFSLGLIREAEGGERRVSVRELQEALGAPQLFSEGCGGADGATLGMAADVPAEGVARALSQADDGGEVDSDAGEAEGEADDDAAAAQADAAHKTSPDAADSESEETQEVAQPGESAPGGQTAVEQETDGNSSSVLVSVISTTASILTAPLRPVVSTITQLPGQVTYVLQEDLGVLSALPGDTFSLLHLLTSDLFSWIGAAADTLFGFGKNCGANVYHCSSCMLGELLGSCYTGVTGMGTLAGDAVGILGDSLDNCWWVTRFFGGRVWDHSEGYVGTVVSEMGGQAKAVGGGFGRLAWRSGNGVGNIFRMGAGVIMGVIDMTIGLVQEAFGQEAES